MNTLPANQTYTYATVTTDANGAINSITSNSIPAPIIPVKVASAYGTYSSSYISFTINTNGIMGSESIFYYKIYHIT